MEANLAPSPEQSKCQCGARIWLAEFRGGGRRAVELAPKQPSPGGRGLRYTGHVSLTFPLVPGAGVLGAIVRTLTRYRLHLHTAHVAGARAQKARP
jgi:hypothetical protein